MTYEHIKIRPYKDSDWSAWDTYVNNHPQATLYHLSGWKNVIEKTYGHRTYYLMAINTNQRGQKPEVRSQKPAISNKNPVCSIQFPASSIQQPQLKKRNPNCFQGVSRKSEVQDVVGILPLVHLKHFLFGNSLISIPFFDLGGVLADDEDSEKALLSEAIRLGNKLKINNIQLRHIQPLSWINDRLDQFQSPFPISYDLSAVSCLVRSHKTRMLLELPESSEILMKSFKSKLRSQIRKPMKEGLTAKIGGFDELEQFYRVFAANMRDLGSPVHSKRLMKNVLEEFPDKAKIVVVYKEDHPVACSLVVGFKDTLENPWASALREYSRLSPNMLLYWTMLEYACDNDYSYFDFGRSSPNEGTYKFKAQWGAKPTTLNWHYISLNSQVAEAKDSEKSKFNKAVQYWQKLPFCVTKIVGPMIRKHIGL